MLCSKCKASLDVKPSLPYVECSSCGALTARAHPLPKPDKVQVSLTPEELRLVIDYRSPWSGGILIALLISGVIIFTYMFFNDPETKGMGAHLSDFMREEPLLFLLPMLSSLVMPLAIFYFALTRMVNRNVITVTATLLTRATTPLLGLDRPMRAAPGDIESLEAEHVKNYGYRARAVTVQGRSLTLWPTDTNPLMVIYLVERVREYLDYLKDREGSPFYEEYSQALDNGDCGKILAMLDKNPRLAGIRSAGGKLALTVAASGGHRALAKIALDLGADVNGREWRSLRTALHFACHRGDGELVDLLLAHRAEVNCIDNEMATALHLALAGTHRKIAEKLTSRGAQDIIAYTTKDPGFPFARLAPLLALPILFTIIFTLQMNSVHMAANRGDLKKVRAYIDANPGLLNEPSAKLLETPLHEAAGMGRLEVVKYLVEKGADCSLKDSSGHTALEKAIDRGHNDVALFLIEHAGSGKKGMEGTLLHHAAWNGNIEMARLLLEKGTEVNGRDKAGKTALHYAISADYLDVAKLLIEKGADVNSLSAGKENGAKTPLHSARSDKAVRILVRKDADVNAKDNEGKTPLHYAAEGHGSAVEELIAGGAEVNARDSLGKTPLYYARNYRYSKKFITEHGGKE
ncbi:MAG: ankyrin repeat domain-containing protein [Candidatus Eremiobacteraeota bacterium]|nr:ankyrin repeat domain-containing protein [Candidatus Eremiobacteraeota bacterium]